MINIFGAGPTGSIIARRYAEIGEKVTVYELRDHIAGNLYDYVDDNGVIVHKYGPHIFQTSDEEVIEFVKEFSEWNEFRHKVNVVIGDKEVPLPINFESIDILFDNSEIIKSKLLENFPDSEVTYVMDLLNVDDEVLKKFGKFVYDNVFENYTTKMWGISPEEIDPSVLRRVPVRLSYDDGYFSDTMQAVPKFGYTKFIDNILSHENIDIKLNCAKDIIYVQNGELIVDGNKNDDKMNIYTGPIDALFKFDEGEIPYRSLKFVFEKKEHIYNSRYVVNYPAHPTMTRITDYRLLSQQENEDIIGTTIGKEYPGEYRRGSNEFPEPYYPINNDVNDSIVSNYQIRASKISNLKLVGRLAQYKYKQMAHAIKDAMDLEI